MAVSNFLRHSFSILWSSRARLLLERKLASEASSWSRLLCSANLRSRNCCIIQHCICSFWAFKRFFIFRSSPSNLEVKKKIIGILYDHNDWKVEWHSFRLLCVPMENIITKKITKSPTWKDLYFALKNFNTFSFNFWNLILD